VYWQLVRSVRRGRKVVQQTVAQLGELDAEGRARAEALARSIAGREWEDLQGQLFERSKPNRSVAVKLDGVRLERSRSFGAVWLGWLLWRALKLDELCGVLLVSKRETVLWSEVIAVLVIGRLCEPSSELHVAERWYRTTALEDLLGVATEDVYDERLYRALDRLLPHKQAIEKHLVKRLGELFDLDYDLLLYDVTSTYFEGLADPSIAKRGYSRDHRPDCVQVNIALVVSREGMPLGYEIFSGNTTDVTTVQQMVQSMEDRFGKVNRVWVMDRGMVSAENIAWLNATARRYVIGTPRTELRRFTRSSTYTVVHQHTFFVFRFEEQLVHGFFLGETDEDLLEVEIRDFLRHVGVELKGRTLYPDEDHASRRSGLSARNCVGDWMRICL
jgi:hypothetical protein